MATSSLRLIVTGSRSRLGIRLYEAADRLRYPIWGIDRIAGDRTTLGDITQMTELRNLFESFQPSCILHAAAITDVDLCEKNPELAWKTHVQGSETVARVCSEMNLRLIQVSTDYVFDGRSGPYSESDSPNPINVYGRTKLEAEIKVREICADSLTVRTCVPYDWNLHGAPNFLMWLIEKLRQGETLSIVEDQWNTPTYNPHLAEVLIDLAGSLTRGVLHVAGSDFISRYDFAALACDIFGFDRKRLKRAQSKHLKQIAPRPMKAGLKVLAAEKILGKPMLTIDDGLKRAFQIYKKL